MTTSVFTNNWNPGNPHSWCFDPQNARLPIQNKCFGRSRYAKTYHNNPWYIYIYIIYIYIIYIYMNLSLVQLRLTDYEFEPKQELHGSYSIQFGIWIHVAYLFLTPLTLAQVDKNVANSFIPALDATGLAKYFFRVLLCLCGPKSFPLLSPSRTPVCVNSRNNFCMVWPLVPAPARSVVFLGLHFFSPTVAPGGSLWGEWLRHVVYFQSRHGGNLGEAPWFCTGCRWNIFQKITVLSFLSSPCF